MKTVLETLNRVGGKLFFRFVSIVPILLIFVLIKTVVDSFNQQAYLSCILLIVPTVLLAMLVRYLWSSKRTVGDIVEANS